MLANLIRFLGCSRADLNLVTTAKGLAYGALAISCNGSNHNLSADIFSIERNVCSYSFAATEPAKQVVILLIEKDTIF